MNNKDAMTIADVRVTRLLAPWTDPPAFSPDFDRPREIVTVEVETRAGVVGMGYLLLLGGGSETIAACLRELVIPRLAGRRVSEVEAVWQDLWRANYWVGRMGVTLFAQSAVDVALWDALARHAGLPLHALWGTCRTRLPAYGSGCWRGLGRDGMIDKARRHIAAGFTAIKMQAGHIHDARQTVENHRAMRDAVGPDIDIMTDVNMGWRADEAIVIGRKLQEIDLYWLEEPVPCEDFAGYLRVAEALDTRVVGGESHFTRFDLRPFFENPRLPILQPDVMRGGLTELRKIATVADSWGMTIAPHLFPELMVQLMASIPNPHLIEYVDWMDDAWEAPILPERGVYTAPDRPGHGLTFRPDFVAEYRAG